MKQLIERASRQLMACLTALVCTGLFMACADKVENPVKAGALPDIYPDYVEVTIPAGVAPLNFCLADETYEMVDVMAKGERGGEMHSQGEYADFDIDEWHDLTEQNKGAAIVFTVCGRKNGKWTQFDDFKMFVSQWPLDDYGVTYRRIPPGYEVGGPQIGIFQRDLSNFEETPILTEDAMQGHCMNCHTANRTDPQLFTSQLRGEHGGTLIQSQGTQKWYNTKTDSTKAAGSYAYWHPSGTSVHTPSIPCIKVSSWGRKGASRRITNLATSCCST